MLLTLWSRWYTAGPNICIDVAQNLREETVTPEEAVETSANGAQPSFKTVSINLAHQQTHRWRVDRWGYSKTETKQPVLFLGILLSVAVNILLSFTAWLIAIRCQTLLACWNWYIIGTVSFMTFRREWFMLLLAAAIHSALGTQNINITF